MRYKNLLIIIFYLTIAYILTVLIFGFKNLSFTNTQWLAAHDVSTDIISWKFFKNDIWRFPIGSNPNYGMDIGSGIVFSGSVPILAFFFKIFVNFLPENFHYFTFWVYICLFLQSYVAYLIIFDQTKNKSYSIIGSFFFLLSPILINKLSFHISLIAHWLILLGFYLEFKKNTTSKILKWSLLISISSLIHFYFTVMLLIIFLIFNIFNRSSVLNYKKISINIFVIFFSLFLTMLISGYFHVPATDALAYGYGNYALDLASLFVSKTNVVNGSINWSLILNNKYVLAPEGFAYLGLGGIIFLIFLIFYFYQNLKNIVQHKKFLPVVIILIIFFCIAISNKIYFLNQLIFSIEIPNFIYGLLSVVRASGRLVWPIYYIVFLFSIILIFKNFSYKNSLIILIFIFALQLLDIYPGIKKHLNSNAFVKEKNLEQIDFWKNLSKNNSILRTTYLNNQSKFLLELRNVLLLKNIEKTDISIHGRYNRKLASISRSKLYQSFQNENLPDNTIFVIDNYNHLRNLKYIFEDSQVGFFLKDKTWVMIPEYKRMMSKFDEIQLDNFNPILLETGNEFKLDFINENSIHGFGWTHNFGSKDMGIWTEGKISNLLFQINKEYKKNLTLGIKVKSILNRPNESLNFKIYINNQIYDNYNLNNVEQLDQGMLFINLNNVTNFNDTFNIRFVIDNPTTKLELLQSPDARILGLLVESVIINED